MSTKKDLVEAHSFTRRRLVTAFVSGAPGGREVEPTKPGRALGGGLALALLLCAGGLIAGWFGNRAASDWLDPGLIISENGTRYVITDDSDPPVLHRVPNYATALLLLGPSPEPNSVPDEDISEQEIGQDIGIVGAPDIVPEESTLIDEGWTACVDERTGVRATISQTPGVTRLDGGEAFVVRNDGDGSYWLVGQAPATVDDFGSTYRFRLPQTKQALINVLDRLGLGTPDQARSVPETWLNLFPAGTSLADSAIGVPRGGRPTYGDLPPEAKLGTLVEFDGRSYLLAEDGAVAVTDFQRQLVLGLRPHAPVQVGSLPTADGDLPGDWPTATPTTMTGEFCAQLMPREGEPPAIWMATDPDEQASAADVPQGRTAPVVDAYHGGLMRFGSFEDSSGGSTFLIDGQGVAFPLLGAEVPTQLGYAGHEIRTAPDAWLDLYREGVELSVAAAREPIDHQAEQ